MFEKFKKPKKMKTEKLTEEYLKSENVVGELLRIQDVVAFFKYDLNPAYLDAKIEAEISKILKTQRTVPFQWIAVIAVLILVSAVAYSIVSGVMAGGQCQSQLLACVGSGGTATTPAGGGTSGLGGIVQGAVTGSSGVGLR